MSEALQTYSLDDGQPIRFDGALAVSADMETFSLNFPDAFDVDILHLTHNGETLFSARADNDAPGGLKCVNPYGMDEKDIMAFILWNSRRDEVRESVAVKALRQKILDAGGPDILVP